MENTTSQKTEIAHKQHSQKHLGQLLSNRKIWSKKEPLAQETMAYSNLILDSNLRTTSDQQPLIICKDAWIDLLLVFSRITPEHFPKHLVIAKTPPQPGDHWPNQDSRGSRSWWTHMEGRMCSLILISISIVLKLIPLRFITLWLGILDRIHKDHQLERERIREIRLKLINPLR